MVLARGRGWLRPQFDVVSRDTLYRTVLDINLSYFDNLLHSARWLDMAPWQLA